MGPALPPPRFKERWPNVNVVNRVQNASNTITWQFSSGDPSPIDILVVNSNNATLNGAFSIARFVNVSIQVRIPYG